MEKLTMRIQRNNNLNDVYYEDEVGPGNGRHYYEVRREGKVVASIQFKNGPRTIESSIPGVVEADLLEIVRHRLQCFQKGEFATRENALAITAIEEALMWMNKRTEDRAERGTLGTYQK